MSVRNLTPHEVTIVTSSGEVLFRIPADPEGPARLTARTVSMGTLDGVPMSRTVFGEPTGLPEAIQGTILIVSQILKSALPGRADLVVPAEVVRDSDGRILGCQSLGI